MDLEVRKKGFKSLPIAINSESEHRQATGRRSQMAGNPFCSCSVLWSFFKLCLSIVQ